MSSYRNTSRPHWIGLIVNKTKKKREKKGTIFIFFNINGTLIPVKKNNTFVQVNLIFIFQPLLLWSPFDIKSFVESVIDLALKSAVWQLCISRLVLSTM